MQGTRRLFVYAIAAVLAIGMLTVPASAQLNQPYHRNGWILGAAHSPGSNGAIWRTDLWIACEEVMTSTTVTLYFNKSGHDNSHVMGVSVPLTPGRTVYHIEDVVDEFLDIGDGSWVGAIHYVANTDLQVWARVYSISADGNRSYGQMIEGIPSADATPDDDPWDARQCQWIYAVKHTANNRYRVNIGVINPGGVAGTFRVRLFRDDGSSTGQSVLVDVPPYSMIQLSDPFASYNGGSWDSVIIRVEALTEDSQVFAYASVVDNATNDAYFVRGIKRLRPDQ